MLSCDEYSLSKITSRTYNEITLSCGISNYFYEIPYGGKFVFGMAPRDFGDYFELLDKIKIKYRTLSTSEIFDVQRSNYSNILVLVPTVLIDCFDKIKTGVVQLSATYSVYSIKEVKNEILHLIIEGEEINTIEKFLTRAQVEKLKSISIKPNGYVIEFIEILKEDTFTIDDILKGMEESLQKCISNNYFKESKGDYVSGPQAYDRLSNMLYNFENYNEAIKGMLVYSINSGSMFFFRREFADALKEYDIISVADYELLYEAGGYWRKLGRMISNNKQDRKVSFDRDKAVKYVDVIKKLEMSSFLNIYMKIKKMTGCNKDLIVY